MDGRKGCPIRPQMLGYRGELILKTSLEVLQAFIFVYMELILGMINIP